MTLAGPPRSERYGSGLALLIFLPGLGRTLWGEIKGPNRRIRVDLGETECPTTDATVAPQTSQSRGPLRAEIRKPAQRRISFWQILDLDIQPQRESSTKSADIGLNAKYLSSPILADALMPTLVEVVPYDPNWRNEFSAAEALLRTTLTKWVVAVDHIGSTAVPGLPAKPIIDVDVTLSGPDVVPDASAALIEVGFESRGNRYDDDVWAFLLKRPAPQVRAYLCSPSNKTHERRMLFRNYLRQHGDAASAYAVLKRRLAEQFPYDGDRYTAGKSAFISKVVRMAQKDAG